MNLKIKVEVKGRGKELRFETETPEEAVRKVALFIRDNYPDIYQKLFGSMVKETVP